MDSLTGSVERITFYNPENGYTVLKLKTDQGRIQGATPDGLTTVTGNFPELSSGEYLHLQGQWVTHARHGLQFQVEVCTHITPPSITGIRRYLGSGLIKGIGPRLADRIVSRFGAQTFEIIENQPQRLTEVPDIGPKRARLVSAAWEEQKQVKEIMLFLHSHNITTNLAIKIYKQYGQHALSILRENPYQLARDLYGVGFKTADKIAQNLGLPADHPARIETGLIYILNQASDMGHVFLPLEQLFEQAEQLLGVCKDLLVPAWGRLEQDQRVKMDELPAALVSPRERKGNQELPKGSSLAAASAGSGAARLTQPAAYFLPSFQSETGVADRLRKLISFQPSRLRSISPDRINIDPSLSEEQQAALRTAISHPVSVLTGGPGTGKTTALRALISILDEANKRYALASPTGRAAKRLSQATGKPASTVHRLLGFSPIEGFKYDAENPLPVDILVVDEASMLDQMLAFHLLKALEPGTHLMIVGDVDQLPSVGAGDILRDVITSQKVPVTRLSLIFRQAAGSQIITNAHRINQGLLPLFSGSNQAGEERLPQDFFLFPAETPDEAARWVQDVVCNRIPQKFGFHPSRELQVLSPMYRGPAGVTALNQSLQENLNPPDAVKQEKKLFGQLFRVGDKVMQTQNNYEKEVFNGDLGFLFAIHPVDQRLIIDFDGRTVEYDWSEADQLALAYAISVHKSQGSEFPAVVLLLITQHYMMLQRNLLYTAISRARQLCVLVGSRKAISMAVHNHQVAHRYTALGWRLSSGNPRSID